jgi:hypothetical protein
MKRGEGGLYAIVQHSPSCVRDATVRSNHVRYLANSKVGGN